MRAALTFSESNLLEFVEFAPPAAQLVAEIARSLEPVLGVLGNEFSIFQDVAVARDSTRAFPFLIGRAKND